MRCDDLVANLWKTWQTWWTILMILGHQQQLVWKLLYSLSLPALLPKICIIALLHSEVDEFFVPLPSEATLKYLKEKNCKAKASYSHLFPRWGDLLLWECSYEYRSSIDVHLFCDSNQDSPAPKLASQPLEDSDAAVLRIAVSGRVVRMKATFLFFRHFLQNMPLLWSNWICLFLNGWVESERANMRVY